MSDFNIDFKNMTDDELDEYLSPFYDAVRKHNAEPSVINTDGIKKVAIVYETMRRLLAGTGARISYELHEPWSSSGVVTVIAKSLSFTNISAFGEAARSAANYEIYPRVDGRVQLNFAFDHLTEPINAGDTL